MSFSILHDKMGNMHKACLLQREVSFSRRVAIVSVVNWNGHFSHGTAFSLERMTDRQNYGCLDLGVW